MRRHAGIASASTSRIDSGTTILHAGRAQRRASQAREEIIGLRP